MTQPPGHILLKAELLDFGFADLPLFVNFSVNIPMGVTLVRGGDGRGKSTLLRLLAGVVEPNSGRLYINGISAQKQLSAYRAQVFWAEPRATEYDQLTALEYFALQKKQHARFDSDALSKAVDGLGLGPHLHKLLFMLSTGSKRKVWIAAAFASGAAVTLIDEPLAALDGPSVNFVLAWLAQAAACPERAWVIADYAAPHELTLSGVVDLGD